MYKRPRLGLRVDTIVAIRCRCLTSLNIKPSFTLFHLNLSKMMHVQIPSPSQLHLLNMFSGCTHHTEAGAAANTRLCFRRSLTCTGRNLGGFNMSRGHGSQWRRSGGRRSGGKNAASSDQHLQTREVAADMEQKFIEFLGFC